MGALKIDRVLIGEALVGDGNEVAHIDLIMIAGEGEPTFGAPFVAGATVAAEIVEQKRGPKVLSFKKRRRQNSKRKRGHRQDLTLVKITGVKTA